MTDIELHYGAEEPLRLPFDGDRFRSFHAGPPPVTDVAASVQHALTQSENFPPLAAMCVPGDQVAVVLDPTLPAAETILAVTVHSLLSAGVEADRISVLQPAPRLSRSSPDPRTELPVEIRDQVQWKQHDPGIEDRSGYLAASSSGERIYLMRELLEADVIIPIYAAGYDPLVGYRSPGSLLYPAFSQEAAIRKSLGEGHPELRPDSDRPLRQLVEELSWLLGLQFAVAAVPSRIAGVPAALLGGELDAVQRQGQQLLSRAWNVPLDRRAEAIVISIAQTADRIGWEEIGHAAALGQNLVTRGGRILLLSSLNAGPGPGLSLLTSSRSPKAALQRMRKESPPDLLACTQVASAASWANVSLLSRLDSSVVEDLQLTPLSSIEEAARLIARLEDVVLLDGGAHFWGEIVAE